MSHSNANGPWISTTSPRQQAQEYRPCYAQAYTVNETYERLKKLMVVVVVLVALPSWTHATHSGNNEVVKSVKHKYLNVACANEIDLTAAQHQRRLVAHCKAR